MSNGPLPWEANEGPFEKANNKSSPRQTNYIVYPKQFQLVGMGLENGSFGLHLKQ